MEIGNDLIVLIDPRRPTGVGESLSGDKAFYINLLNNEDWPHVEADPAFTELAAEEKRIVRKKYPQVLERYQIISTTSMSYRRVGRIIP